VKNWWRTQDWFWLVAFIVYAQVFAFLYKELVMDVVGYVSTFIGIALAAVAIYISIREATKGDLVKDQINSILGEMREKLAQMDTKLNKLDPNMIMEIDESSEKTKEDIVNKIQEKDNPSAAEIINIVKDEISKANKDLKISLSAKNNKELNSIFMDDLKREQNFIFNKMVLELPPKSTITLEDVYDYMAKHVKPMSLRDINNKLNYLVSHGHFIELMNNSYKKKNIEKIDK
jgi:TolA-binding protein